MHTRLTGGMGAIRTTLSGLFARVKNVVEPAAKVVEQQAASRYARIMEKNQQYVVTDSAAAGKLGKQWFYTKLAQ